MHYFFQRGTNPQPHSNFYGHPRPHTHLTRALAILLAFWSSGLEALLCPLGLLVFFPSNFIAGHVRERPSDTASPRSMVCGWLLVFKQSIRQRRKNGLRTRWRYTEATQLRLRLEAKSVSRPSQHCCYIHPSSGCCPSDIWLNFLHLLAHHTGLLGKQKVLFWFDTRVEEFKTI